MSTHARIGTPTVPFICPYYACAARFPAPSCLLLCCKFDSPSLFCPPSLVISSFLRLSRRDQAWAMAGYGWWLCPHPHPPRLPSLGVRALRGARHNVCLMLASSKVLGLNSHQPWPGSSSKDCCGKKRVQLSS